MVSKNTDDRRKREAATTARRGERAFFEAGRASAGKAAAAARRSVTADERLVLDAFGAADWPRARRAIYAGADGYDSVSLTALALAALTGLPVDRARAAAESLEALGVLELCYSVGGQGPAR